MIGCLDTKNKHEMLLGKCKSNKNILNNLTHHIKNNHLDKLYKDLDLEIFNSNLSENSFLGKLVSESDRFHRQPKITYFKSEDITVINNIKYELVNENNDFKYICKISTISQRLKIKELVINLSNYNPFNLYILFLNDNKIQSFIDIYLLNNFIINNCKILSEINDLSKYDEWINKFHTISDYITNELGQIETMLLKSNEIQTKIDETLLSLHCYKKNS